MFKDRPRRVSLVHPEGRPVVGVSSSGLTFHPWDAEPRLRSASFLLRGLHPVRPQRMTFTHEDRKLIGTLMARGDGDSPYVVTMQPWASVTGRLLDENGRPLPAAPPGGMRDTSAAVLTLGHNDLVIDPDPARGIHSGVNADAEGRFRVDRLVPGLKYTAEVYRGSGMFGGLAFEDMVLRPGEVKDLGDLRTRAPVSVIGK